MELLLAVLLALANGAWADKFEDQAGQIGGQLTPAFQEFNEKRPSQSAGPAGNLGSSQAPTNVSITIREDPSAPPFQSPPAEESVNVQIGNYGFADPADHRYYLSTTGVDGCIAVILVDPRSTRAGLFHFQWADTKEADTMIGKAIPNGAKLPQGATAIVFGGYPPGDKDSEVSLKSKIMGQYVQDAFKGRGASIYVLPKNYLTPFIRNVTYDTQRGLLYVTNYKINDGSSSPTQDVYRITKDPTGN